MKNKESLKKFTPLFLKLIEIGLIKDSKVHCLGSVLLLSKLEYDKNEEITCNEEVDEEKNDHDYINVEDNDSSENDSENDSYDETENDSENDSETNSENDSSDETENDSENNSETNSSNDSSEESSDSD